MKYLAKIAEYIYAPCIYAEEEYKYKTYEVFSIAICSVHLNHEK